MESTPSSLPSAPQTPSPDPSFRWVLLILMAIIVAVGIWFVISRGTLITLEESSPVPVAIKHSPRPPPVVPTGETLDQEINNHTATVNSGTSISDIDQDINATDIHASDRELRSLEQEMEVL